MALGSKDIEMFNDQFQRVIGANQSAIDKATADIPIIKADIVEIKADVSTLKEDVKILKQAVKSIEYRLDRVESENQIQTMLLKSVQTNMDLPSVYHKI